MSKENTQNSKSSKFNEKKKALTIAISDYDNLSTNKQLPFCKNDGQAVFDILKKQGYEISNSNTMLGNTNYERMRKVVRDFFREDVKPTDLLLFYFSGHGFFDGLDYYLVTSDINVEKPDDKGYLFEDLTRQMNRSKSQQIISILDCCHSGGLKIGGKDADNNESKAAQESQFAMNEVVDREIQRAQGKCILASSLGLQQSFKMPGHDYSAYSYFLIEGLKGGNGETVNRNGYVTPELLSNYIDKELFNLSQPTRQTPIRKIELVGEMLLAYYPDLAWKSMNENLRTDFTNSNFRGSNFSNRDLSDANFSKSDISAVIFSGSKLYGAIFENANISNSIFKLNNLRHTKFNDVDLSGAIIYYSLLDQCEILNSRFTNVELHFCDANGNFSNSNFSNLHALFVDFSNSNLSNVNLSYSFLHHCDLSYTNLNNINLSEADFYECDLLNIREYNGLICKNTNFRESQFNDQEFVNYLRSHGAVNVSDSRGW